MGLVDEIRKQADGNGSKIQTTEEARFEKLLNGAFYLEHDIERETRFINMVMTRGAETQERIGLHASNMLTGDKDFCLRFQVLSLLYHQDQGENIEPGLKRIFEMGNAVHEKWQRH